MNETWTLHTLKWKQTYIDMYIYTHKQKFQNTQSHANREKITVREIQNKHTHTHTFTHTQLIKYQKQMRLKENTL